MIRLQAGKGTDGAGQVRPDPVHLFYFQLALIRHHVQVNEYRMPKAAAVIDAPVGIVRAGRESVFAIPDMKITFHLLLGGLLGASSLQTAFAGPEASAGADKMKWFEQARFGMFIHWGIYSVPAGEWRGKTNYAEWIMLQGKIPSADYQAFAQRFDPVKFNADAWVKVAKDAGMKYLVITAKHHDGFSMYDSKLTDYSVVRDTPWHHDPMRDLEAACRKAGIVFCFYYSIPDWHHPDFPAKYSQHGFHGDPPNPGADLEKYVAYMKGQVRELLSNYGPIGIMWFDGGGSFKGEGIDRAKLIHAQEIIDEVHRLQPRCLVNNRLGLPGDYGTPEQRIPGGKQKTAFEVCMTLNRHWGYNRFDDHWKSAQVVVSNLVDIASKGGNYLLNVGPTSEGVFPPEAIRILGDVGKWMKVNGDSIYGTTASPLEAPPDWGRITQKGDTFYLHVMTWPADGKLQVVGLPAVARRAFLLVNHQRLKVQAAGETISMSLPSAPLDPTDTVVVLETSPRNSASQ